MGIIIDLVPNHMGIDDPHNGWWQDVLENGPSSAYASYFDIDWHPTTSKAAFLQENRVLLPILGNLYGNVLAGGELQGEVGEELQVNLTGWARPVFAGSISDEFEKELDETE